MAQVLNISVFSVKKVYRVAPLIAGPPTAYSTTLHSKLLYFLKRQKLVVSLFPLYNKTAVTFEPMIRLKQFFRI